MTVPTGRDTTGFLSCFMRTTPDCHSVIKVADQPDSGWSRVPLGDHDFRAWMCPPCFQRYQATEQAP